MKKLLKNTIWSKNFFTVVIAILVPVIVINGMLFYNIGKMTEKNIFKDVEQKLSQNKLRVDILMRDTKLLATQIANNQDVIVYMYSGKRIISNVYSRLSNLITTYTNINSHLDSFYIYSKLNKRVFQRNAGDVSIDDLDDKNWIDKIHEKDDDYINIFSRKKENVYPRLITMAFNVFEGKNKSIGNIVININSEAFASLFDSIDTESKFFIVDNKDVVIYGTNGLLEGESIMYNSYFPYDKSLKKDSVQYFDMNGDRYILASAVSSSFDWRYINVIPEAHYNQRIQKV